LEKARVPVIKVIKLYQERNSNVSLVKQTKLFQSIEHDWNFDGRLDELEFQLEMPLRPDENIFEIHLLLFFDVKLHVSTAQFNIYLVFKSRQSQLICFTCRDSPL
jgi:hypothetical protein